MKPSFAPHVWQGILAGIAFVAASVHLAGDVLTFQVALPSYLVGVVASLLALVGIFSRALPEVQRARAAWVAANALKVVAAALLVIAVGATQSACLSSAPIVPVTAANQQQVQTCESTATLHDGVVVGDFVFGGAGATMGAIAAALPGSNPSLSTDLAVGAAVAAGIAAAGAGISSLTAANFANSNCSTVVGPLPAASAPKSARRQDGADASPSRREANAQVRLHSFATVTWGEAQ